VVYREPLSNMSWGMPHEGSWHPPTDVYETGEDAIVIVEVAGLSQGNYEISLSGRILTVSGERIDPAEKLAYQQLEIHYGRFRTEVHLPWALDGSHHQATYEDGFLRISLRKAKTRRIPVSAS
jgi:HSP20 family protein